MIDWERNANGGIDFSNPRLIEFAPGLETPIVMSVETPSEDKENSHLGEDYKRALEIGPATEESGTIAIEGISRITDAMAGLTDVVRAAAPSDDTTQRLQNIKDAVAEAAFVN